MLRAVFPFYGADLFLLGFSQLLKRLPTHMEGNSLRRIPHSGGSSFAQSLDRRFGRHVRQSDAH